MKNKLHTAEHILFTILQKNFVIKSEALQFGENFCRVVYQCDQDLCKTTDLLEKKVNKIINQNLEVLNYTISRQEAEKSIDLNLVPISIEQISIYEIVDFNKMACIGPHVKNTKEIGEFKILKIEKKGKNSFTIKFTINNK